VPLARAANADLLVATRALSLSYVLTFWSDDESRAGLPGAVDLIEEVTGNLDLVGIAGAGDKEGERTLGRDSRSRARCCTRGTRRVSESFQSIKKIRKAHERFHVRFSEDSFSCSVGEGVGSVSTLRKRKGTN